MTFDEEKLLIYTRKLLKEERVRKTWSQAKLGEESDYDGNNVGRIERGESVPQLLTFLKLVIALDIEDFIARLKQSVNNEES